jgi:nicotinate-nucleotide pyrophosphorylase (carboxylating)
MESILIDRIIKNALEEDLGWGDVTTDSTIAGDVRMRGNFIAKEDGIISGIEVCRRVFEILDDSIEFVIYKKDGDRIAKGDIAAAISGSAGSILKGERTALNLLQRMSGIATLTARFVKQLDGLPARIVDTRKTAPGLRILDKYSVRMGGGHNHRYNLSDMVLIKDNHINAAGSITAAVKAARDYAPLTLKIEVETESLDQVAEALSAGADIIMLDNMSMEMMAQAVKMINKQALVEASGNMDEKDLYEVASTGVDFISIGALTNSLKPLDISLKFF